MMPVSCPWGGGIEGMDLSGGGEGREEGGKKIREEWFSGVVVTATYPTNQPTTDLLSYLPLTSPLCVDHRKGLEPKNVF